jgi:hypothetical protein
MDRRHRPDIETRAIEDGRRLIHPRGDEPVRSVSAPRADGPTSGILRELAERMRHWD